MSAKAGSNVAFGIVGCGNIARFHFNGLEKAGVRVAHIADLNETAARPWVEKTGARFSLDYRALVADPQVTAVSVLTHSRFHREICEAALDAGKDVVCEKTMMDNAAEAAAIVRKARGSGRLFFTCYMKRFFPAVRKARELMPRLGKLYSAHVRSCQPWGDLFSSPDAAKLEWILKNYGGAVVKCAGSHMIDMSLFLLGRPRRLAAHIDFIPGTKIDRKAEALWVYDGGLTVQFETVAHPLNKVGYERRGWDESIEISGAGGRLELSTVVWDHPDNNAPLLIHHDNESGTSTEYRFDPMNPFDAEMAEFAARMARREQGNPDIMDGFNVDALIETMFLSSAGGRFVEVNWRAAD